MIPRLLTGRGVVLIVPLFAWSQLMKPTTPRTVLTLLLGLTTLALVSAPLSHSSQAASKAQDVIVVNPPSAPVPTISQGTVTVSGTVSVAGTPAVTLAGTPGVAIAGTPTVNLAAGTGLTVNNTAASPVLTRDVDRAGQTPVDVEFDTVAPNIAATYVVPAGLRLTIRSASGVCNTTIAANTTAFVIETSVGGHAVRHFLPNPAASTNPFMAVQLLAFADGGTPVTFRPANGPNTDCILSFAGYLQPM
jgi:hypothetical protein